MYSYPFQRLAYIAILEKPDDPEILECPFSGRCAKNPIMDAKNASIPLKPRTINAGDLIATKKWQTLAVSGYMLPDPYSGAQGVKQISENTWEVTVRVTSEFGDKAITFALGLLEPLQQSKLVFSPLLNRFFKGKDFRTRAVKISDSGRIRNELQILCTELPGCGQYVADTGSGSWGAVLFKANA